MTLRNVIKAMVALVIAVNCAIQAQAQQAPNLLTPPPHPAPVQSPAAVPAPTNSPARPLTITDVVAMQRAGLDDPVIIASLQQHGMAGTLSATELISMRQHGVSNAVIQAMQQTAPLPQPRVAARPTHAAGPATVTARTIVTPPPTVVRPILVTPRYYYDPFYFPHHHHHHWRPAYCPRRASSFGIHIGF